MAHKGLNLDVVVKAAAELIEQQGRDAFSMRLLAEQLGIKTASFYNHVDNMEMLLAEVCRYGLCLQNEMEMQAMEGRHGEDAVRQLADTYRNFAKKHRELYWLIMAMSAKDKRVRDDAAVLFTEQLKKNAGRFSFKRRGKHYLPALISGHSPWLCGAGGAGVLLPLSGGGG